MIKIEEFTKKYKDYEVDEEKLKELLVEAITDAGKDNIKKYIFGVNN